MQCYSPTVSWRQSVWGSNVFSITLKPMKNWEKEILVFHRPRRFLGLKLRTNRWRFFSTPCRVYFFFFFMLLNFTRIFRVIRPSSSNESARPWSSWWFFSSKKIARVSITVWNLFPFVHHYMLVNWFQYNHQKIIIQDKVLTRDTFLIIFL